MPSRTLPSPSQTSARSWLLTFSLPLIPGRHFFLRKDLFTDKTRLPCFPAYLLEITRVSACPTGNQPGSHHDTSLRPVAKPSPCSGKSSPAPPTPARECSILAPEMMVKRHKVGISLPLERVKTPTGSSGHCGNGSCSAVTPAQLPRPPRASSEELMKSAGCGQPLCSTGMFWSRLLTLCFAYCVSNATCFYTPRVNNGRGLSARNEVLMGAVSSPAAPRCAAGIFLHYSCIQLSPSLLRTIPAPSLITFSWLSPLCSSALSWLPQDPQPGQVSLGCSSLSQALGAGRCGTLNREEKQTQQRLFWVKPLAESWNTLGWKEH